MQFRRIEIKKIGDLLVEKGIISYGQLQEALKLQKKESGLLGTILVRLGHASEVEIAQVITVQYGLPYLPLSSYELDGEIIKLIPRDIAKKFCLIAVDRMGDTLTIAMANPLDPSAIEEIEKLTGLKIQVFISTMTDIVNAIEKYYGKA